MKREVTENLRGNAAVNFRGAFPILNWMIPNLVDVMRKNALPLNTSVIVRNSLPCSDF